MTTVLVIDDEDVLREELIELLMFAGYHAVGAPNGTQGIAYALQHHPDVILCEITMPELNGHQVLAELRTKPSTASVPFIFMTARAADDDIRQGLDMGADHYITKPFRHKSLLEAIEAIVVK